MPIPDHELEKRFLIAGEDTTVNELRVQVQAAKQQATFLIVRQAGGSYGVALLDEVAEAIYRLGPSALDLPLASLPPVAEPTAAIQRTDMGLGEAERLRDRQPRRRLVILDRDTPIGLLTNESRGASASGLPLRLFGSYTPLSNEKLHQALAAKHEAQTCPFCNRQFTFYELRSDLKAYACPHCHRVLSG